ncbi:tail fiber protein [Oxalobacter paraformigenes]|uniref:Phage tail collar domain-containing protein n=1 Tax=Oxalobacter paraformigenes TaxID=556268 RepID=C3X3V5_9BURK|nr:tail fiber protein [Oxalobacter paraformigenes]EEO27891.2 hypothetical protein OFAG_01044 [Oxalobacter paraformigenes]
MTQLPEKNLLDGSKLPKTTTGEMKDALGKLRDYLNELLGEDSADKEAARLALGIDLAELESRLDVLARNKADRSELDAKTDASTLEAAIQAMAESGVPVGSVHYFAMAEPPAGYLKCDGAAVGRDMYPELFSAIGTAFGAGDGETTFNLPDMIGRFAEGSATPGTVKEAGLPNATGTFTGFAAKNSPSATHDLAEIAMSGMFHSLHASNSIVNPSSSASGSEWFVNCSVATDLSRSNALFGASDTVQPPALTLLPCIKAFHAAINRV